MNEKASKIGATSMIITGIAVIVVVWWNAFAPMSASIMDAWMITFILTGLTGFFVWVVNYD